MLKKFNQFIKENVDVLDPTKTTTTQKPENDGDRGYLAMFIVKDNKIHDNGVVLLSYETLDEIESKKAVSGIYLYVAFLDDSHRVYKVDMTKEQVIAARSQTGLPLDLNKSFTLDPNHRLYYWLLENIDTLPPTQRARTIK